MNEDTSTAALAIVQPDQTDLAAAAIACKGMRSTRDAPTDLSGLRADQIAHHDSTMRNSHAFLVRARGQLHSRSCLSTVMSEIHA